MPAHAGEPLQPHDLWTAWNLEPWLLIPLIVTVFLYMWGMRRLWRRAGTGRGITARGRLSFLGGMLALLVALVSPLDALAGVLFAAHMIQHMVIVLVAAPLLVMSDFGLAALWALPRRWSQAAGQGWNGSRALSGLWRAISSPISAWFLFAAAMWLWHAPALYEAALWYEVVHDLEHLIFLLTALLFWWVLLRRTTQQHLQYGMAIPYLFTTLLHSGILGALMTFAAEPWYPYYTTLVEPWGLTPMQDQQLAGLIMWIPGGTVFTLLTIGYFAAWLRVLEQRSMRRRPRDPLRTHRELE